MFIFLYGLSFGAFANACIYRFYLNESLFKRSHCLSCNHVLGWLDLIPILSYFLFKGKCRYCGEKRSSLQPMIEFVCACTWFFLYIMLDTTSLFFTLALLTFLIIFLFGIVYTSTEFKKYDNHMHSYK